MIKIKNKSYPSKWRKTIPVDWRAKFDKYKCGLIKDYI